MVENVQTVNERPAPPKRLTKGQRTRLRIFDAALELFGWHGFAAVSLRDIAAEVGVTHVTVLHYFSSKDDLLIQLMVHRDEIEREAGRVFLESAHGPDQALGGLQTPMLQWFLHRLERNAAEQETAPLFLKIATEATDPAHPAHEHFVERYELLIQRLAEAIEEEFAHHPDRSASVSARAAAQHLIAIADGAQIQAIYARDASRVVDDVWDYLELLGLVTR